jgi:putative salt-induced outer membrane protein
MGRPIFPRVAALAAVLASGVPGVARAQAPADSLGWHFLGALGYVQTSGNTELSSVNLLDRLTFRPSTRWTFAQTAAWIYGYNDSTETANQIVAGLRADCRVGSYVALYALVGYERNPFAGVQRRFDEGVGLSWKAVNGPKHVFSMDFGAGNNQQVTGGVSTTFFVARLAPTYRFNITDKAYFQESLEFLENLDDTGDLRTVSTTSLVAPLTGAISMRFGYLMRYDAVPVPGFKKLDTTFTSGIQLAL